MSNGFASYGKKQKDLLTLINQLRTLGADSELDLPRIAVIGNQSAGKLSVVEAISGISVPRDAGTCTRCPMECRMTSSSSPWSCSISIRRAYDASGRPLDDVSQTQFGPVLTDKSEVEHVLRRAQLSVLNEKIPLPMVLDASLDQVKAWARESAQRTPFSKNVVCVSLEGPDLPDLSFIDLPGLIHNADSDTINLVANMVLENIGGNCLILVAIPMTDDIDNQVALKLARKVDTAGRRTIGVLTKPDMLTERNSSLRLWLEVMEGRSSPLHLGYFCTRQPDDEDRRCSITQADARAKEKTFFESTSPWSTSTQRHRLGTVHLVEMLSKQLMSVIDSSLPNLAQQASEQLLSISEELDTLPRALDTDPATHALNLITSFCGEVNKYVQGGTGYSSLIHKNRDAFKRFKIDIRKTAPCFIPRERTSEVTYENRLDDDEPIEELGHGVTEGGIGQQISTLSDMRAYLANATTRELPNNIPFDAKTALINDFQQTWMASVRLCFGSVQKATHDHLVALIKHHFSRYERMQSLFSSHILDLESSHRSTCERFLQVMIEKEKTPYTQNTHYLEDSTEKWLAKFRSIRSAKRSRFLDDDSEPGSPPPPSKRQRQEEGSVTRSPTLDASVECAAGSMDVESVDRLDSAQTDEKSSESSVVLGFLSSNPELAYQVLSGLAELGLTGLKPADLLKLVQTDAYDTELRVMAEIRGYFQIAYKRVIDEIPNLVDLVYVKAISEELQSFLVTKLGLGQPGASEKCSVLLEEDPVVIARRDELVGRKKRLEGVQAELSHFGVEGWKPTLAACSESEESEMGEAV